MATCSTNTCGVGGWGGPLPGDPSNDVILSAVATFGGIDVSWTYPSSYPYAVSYAILYRGNTENFSSAVQHAIVSGNSFYDKIDETVTYFYWIRLVSINGTEADLIGPAQATANTIIGKIIEDLSNQISEGLLAQHLREEIDKITLNYDELLDEISNRVSSDAALAQAIADVQNGLADSIALQHEEVILRQDGDNALAVQLNTLAALNGDNAAAILEERLARVTADSALGLRIDSVNAAVGTVSAAVQDVQTAKIGYSANAAGLAYDGNGSTIVYPAAQYPTAQYPEYAYNRTRIIDKLGVTRWNAIPANSGNQLTWVQGMPLASAVKTVQVTNPVTGGTASVEQTMVAQQGLNNQFKALYGAKVNVNGLIGGFGVYNDGLTVDAGFDVDNFWIGRTQGNKVLPFIVNGGTVYINNAMINQLTADRIDSRGLTIKDAAGNIIFGASNNLAVNRINGLGTLATQNSVSNSQVTGLGSLAVENWVRLGSNVRFPDDSVVAVGDLVSRLSKINSGNIGTFMDGAAITSAYIGNAAIKNANIENLAVTNIKIGNDAVDITKVVNNSIYENRSSTGNPTATVNISVPAGQTWDLMIIAGFRSVYVATGGTGTPKTFTVTLTGPGGVIGSVTDTGYAYTPAGMSGLHYPAGTLTAAGALPPGNYTITSTSSGGVGSAAIGITDLAVMVGKRTT